MKYGLLTYFGSRYCNFGDYVQSVAIEYLLKEELSVDQNDIVYLTEDDIKTYDGEDLILPYSYVLSFLMDASIGAAVVSDKIHPVFLGASIEFATLYDAYSLDNFFDKEKGYYDLFQRYAPIGCRDNATKEFLLNNGIRAYLQGCITNILPKRQNPEGGAKILLIDVPASIIDGIPDEILPNIEVMTNAEDIGDLSYCENYVRIKERYDYYRNNASLIISSRYHVVTPCNAMGIPCVFIKRTIDKHIKDIRLDTMNPQIQVVDEVDFDFNKIKAAIVQRSDDDALKNQIRNLAVSRIKTETALVENTKYIYEFYKPRIEWFKSVPEVKNSYKTRLQTYIRTNYLNVKCRYYIWGAIKLLCDGEKVVITDMVKEVNPEAEFAGWLDTFKKGELAGGKIYSPNEKKLEANEFIIIAAETAVEAAVLWMDANGYDNNRRVVLVNTMLTQKDIEKRLKG